MVRPSLGVRVMSRLMKATSITRMTDDQIARAQRQKLPHNPVTDLIFGGVAAGVAVADDTTDGETGRIPVRVYRPTHLAGGQRPLVVNIHGGGWVLGSLDQSDWLCSCVAATVGAVVVSVDYRLAPADRWPAAPEDCYAALADVTARADRFGADPHRVAVMGDSAGGNLAAVVSLMARDRSGPSIAYQALLYPGTDLTLASPSLEHNAGAPILSRADCVAYRDLYLGGQDPREPYASPLFARDLTGLPPALVQVAEHDPIRDDGLRYAAALRSAGVTVRETTYVGMPHGYFTFPRICRSAPQALAELCAELGSALASDVNPERRS